MRRLACMFDVSRYKSTSATWICVDRKQPSQISYWICFLCMLQLSTWMSSDCKS
ncbi:unnamed protein product [Linum tenue]|uniref:Uncharacterized protein n=1 Tax=Linum tenue TaxID=586396 RepID=A0AAV0S3U3_9ROSI|nr:unnamed protein product [Linum tenue]